MLQIHPITPDATENDSRNPSLAFFDCYLSLIHISHPKIINKTINFIILPISQVREIKANRKDDEINGFIYDFGVCECIGQVGCTKPTGVPELAELYGDAVV